MELTSTPVAEALPAPNTVSGTQVIDAVCDAIAARLAGDCNLRHMDCYRSFAAHVRISLQLHDVGTTEIDNEVQVGALDPAQPVEEFEVALPPRSYVSRIRARR